MLGVGFDEHFLASDVHPLLSVTNRFVYLEEGDVVRLDTDGYEIRDRSDELVQRPVIEADLAADAVQRGAYRHYMQKEIFEQPRAVAETLEGRIGADHVLPNIFGVGADDILRQVGQVHIVACGTSYHAGLVARYQLEELAGIPCMVEVASEYRYRHPVVPERTLFVVISQSGETADTLAALRHAKESGYLATLAICNVPESTIVREAGLVLMTRAGLEIGVASTKAFTTQLVALAVAGAATGAAQRAGRQSPVGGLGAGPASTAGAHRAGVAAGCAASSSWPNTSSRSTMRCSWVVAATTRSPWRAR